MKILITGHKGFIGSHLTKHLSHHEIVGIDINDQSNVLTADLPDVDLVIHLAGKGGVRESLTNPKIYWDNNVVASQRILQHYTNTRVLYASSSSQYEPWLNPYAASKHIIESIPHSNCVAMRFHTVYGDVNRPGMFFDLLLQGKLKYVTEHLRDFIHVDDVCSAIEILIQNNYKGAIDIGTGESIYVMDIAPNLPIRKGSDLERMSSKADTTLLKSMGWHYKWTVQKFLDQHGFDVKLKVY